ncbi:MAG: IS200/IS605 family transposase [Ignavibacteria bacterium]|jgi:REP element-mobilizing transposase RayT
MSNALIKIWIHAIFGTKNSEPIIKPQFEYLLHERIKEKLENDLESEVRVINGTENHVHILFLMNQNYSLKDIMQNIKGESSHWINQNNYSPGKFAWQTGYGAFSVSESKVKEVEEYIKNQKEHHRTKSFKEEYELFIKKHSVKI